MTPLPMKDLSNIIINNKYQLQKRIGSGSYGIVYSAVHLFTGVSYAIKIILKNNSPNTANNKQLLIELEKNLIYQALLNDGCLITNLLNLDSIERYGSHCKFLREISLQLKVHKHPNILSIYKVYDFQNSIFVVMDYYPEGDLFSTIVDKQRYKNDPFLIKSVFIQLIDSINYCHCKNVYHCDLKPENVLVANNGSKLVLADFGLALQDKFIDSNISCGSSYYMAPERIQNFSQAYNSMESHSIHIDRLLNPINHPIHGNVKFPTSAGDVWSLAIILINLISIRNPWLKASLNDATFKAFVNDPKILMKILPISNEIFLILCKYLTLNPWERGSLFDFRHDVLNCNKLSESGPLSINSTIKSMDIITTESQISHFDVCPIPVDHVEMNRIKSRENSLENIELETDYMPRLVRENKLSHDNNPTNFAKPKECKSCVECGFGYSSECLQNKNNKATITNNDSQLLNQEQQLLQQPPQKIFLQQQQQQQQQALQKSLLQEKPSEHHHNLSNNILKKFFSKNSSSSHSENEYHLNFPSKHQHDETHDNINNPAKIKVESLLSDYKSFFPTPGMSSKFNPAANVNKTNTVRRKLITKRRQKRTPVPAATTTGTALTATTQQEKQQQQQQSRQPQPQPQPQSQQRLAADNSEDDTTTLTSNLSLHSSSSPESELKNHSMEEVKDRINDVSDDLSMVSIMSVGDGSDDDDDASNKDS